MTDDSFTTFVLEQLRDLNDVGARRMFGSVGLYSNDTFFGIIHDGRLYCKTDDATRSRYEEAGSEPFRPNEKQTLKRYYEVPADVLEDRDRLASWVRDALDVGE